MKFLKTWSLPFLGACLLLGQADAKHRFIAQDKGHLSIVDKLGQVEWKMKWGGIHDIHQLKNGNFLTQQGITKIVELNPRTQKVVRSYDFKAMYPKQRIEVHSFIPGDSGEVTAAVSGAGEIVTLSREGDVLSKFNMKLNQPHPHKDTRLIRATKDNTILVSHEGDGFVREYTKDGKLVWEYEVPMFGKEHARGHGLSAFGNKVFSSVRLDNGNTLICTGNGHSVIEVTPKKEIVWSLHQNDLEGIQLAWVTTIEVLENGNMIIGNCHAGESNPQLIEITKDKKVVWTFKDWKNFGNALSNSLVLSTYGSSTR